MGDKRKNTLFSYFNKKVDMNSHVPSVDCSDSSEKLEYIVPVEPKHDIGLFINRSLSDVEKNIVLNNLWSPPVHYEFPILTLNSKRNLKFQYRWLETYSWLCYSKIFEGAFCKYCVVFTKVGGVGSQKLGGLVLTAYQNWKYALEVFENHSKLEYHRTALIRGEHFLKLFLTNKPSVIDLLDDDRIKQKKQNRLNLIPIIECVMLCGRQGLALRGHRDSGPICFKSESEYVNEGNFRAILKYKAKDLVHFKEFLENNSRYKYLH